jgi:NADPH-dependent 2,4-dienoyl-CoA reductase/sulfur reductase-like enzyme
LYHEKNECYSTWQKIQNMRVVIIGNGVAGISAAIEIRKQSDLEITIISDETEYFFSRTALMYVFMGHLKFEHTQPYPNTFWADNRIKLIKTTVTKIKSAENKIELQDGTALSYHYLVLAMGSKPNFLNWPGQNLDGVTGLYHKKDLEYLIQKTHSIENAVVIGGGLIGIEMAEMLRSKGKQVTFLVREASFWNAVLSENESKIIENHIRAHGVDLQLNTELSHIIGAEKVKAIITNQQKKITCQLVGLAVGVSPNIGLLKDTEIKYKRGILVNDFLQTNIENVFAIGDCAELTTPQPGRRPIEAVWYTAKMMGQTVAKTICSQPEVYKPGIWFNSAKFFDIEYQTYGNVPAVLEPSQTEFLWQKKQQSIRLVYNRHSGVFQGVNALGIRIKQDFFEKAIKEKQTITQILTHIETANFDPEFFKNRLREVKNSYPL